MGEPSHLERMGRELNCPICLSLLNFAVSLTCNHVFCNSCIMKSMKSGSNCPVCKVPYGRREIRPVPHMDNLVSIYKSMEAASGINMFVSQNTPSTTIPDEQKIEGDQNSREQKSGNASKGRAKNQRKLKGKGPKVSLRSNSQDSGSNSAKPSFPGKKRVQVPQYPLSETPERPAKFDDGLHGMGKGGSKDNSFVVRKNPALGDKGEPIFSPFFWLREDEDGEMSSQQMDVDLTLSSSPPNVPSFSDIKASDDEMPSELDPEGKVDAEFNVAGPIDSEIFDWTQRACSPELCSSPMDIQVPDSEDFDGTENMNGKGGTGYAAVRLLTVYSETQNANDQSEVKFKKRGRKANKKAQNKIARRGANHILGIHTNSENVAGDFIPIEEVGKDGCFLKLGKATEKGFEKDCIGNNAAGAVQGKVNTLSIEDISRDEDDENKVPASSASLEKKHNSDGTLNLRKRGRRCIKMRTQRQKGHTVRHKNQKLESSKDDILQEGAIVQNQINCHMSSHLPSVSLPMTEEEVVSDQSKKDRKDARVITEFNQKCDRKLRSSKKLKVSSDNVLKYGVRDDIEQGHTKVCAVTTQPINNTQCNPEVGVHDYSSTEKEVHSTTDGAALEKCDSISKKYSCAFCRSMEESEASGEMIHYFNGRPIASDYTGELNITHSHKNCTEWAPNVYFEDGTAVNLKAELARSRRIKCCFCGIKGAVLGCYEKSCRRSFHFPCAKLTPQCRWDTDNFVMLCPLHASSKLPNEISDPPAKTRKKCTLKGQSKIQQTQLAAKHDIGSRPCWNSSGSFGRLVLCCSALTAAEKEVVSEFEKLSGVTLLKKWGPGITHVIASTDENGACRRTLKFLMGILEGKWILSMEWIKACMKAKELVAEEQYEIGIDIHGIRDGPRLGRLRCLNERPKLFNGFKFYFLGDFMPSYKGYLQDLVIAAGGAVLHRKPILLNQETLLSESKNETFIIYSLELPDNCGPDRKNEIFAHRQSEAEALARSTGAKVASNSWFLNSIAACQVQNVVE